MRRAQLGQCRLEFQDHPVSGAGGRRNGSLQRAPGREQDAGPGTESAAEALRRLDNGATLYIHDAEIVIDDEGRAYSTASESDTEPLVWSFHVVRPLAAHDVPAIERPPLNVAEVVGRLKAMR
ncbi:hypothetical protein [Variovorax sp. RA8]|uniref:hypothetical protein n=1 Tax=Variovorax sp. (strain JCM 16519 / RA8) TaxID=662548 RepID=UPI000B2BD8FA|nr:hypothetical protein [Variovorax sp. RA8]